jgi:hypothetical protein
MERSTSRPTQAKAFRERARLEADRYGPDPWIFVRELLQNSRDAGATRVAFAIHEGDGTERVTCLDDGEGMSFEHARRYLFSLYASSKENDRSQAGKFGVGFWSILRFEPTSITIRSRTHRGEAWGIRLDGSLEHATHVQPLERPGTEITVERKGGDGRLEHRVYDAVWQNGRYLHPRGAPDEFLVLTVGNRSANAEFTLGAPSAAFRRGSVRGVVGLGPAPRVELFSRGLRVRSAACLEDLITPTGRHTSRMRVQFPELPGGLAPQALLESDQLEVMLSRSDARDNRALARLVRLAQRELERLIDRQLAHARPQAWWRHAYEWMRSRLRESLVLRTALGAAAGALCALVIAWIAWGRGPTSALPGGATDESARVAVSGRPPSGPQPYRDLGTRYRGPKVDVLAPDSAEPIELQYRPGHHPLYFASLTMARLARDGSPIHEAVLERLEPYLPAGSCDDDCLQVVVPIATEGKATRIPVPTGTRIVRGSVELDGTPITLHASPNGHPTVVLGEVKRGLLSYQAVHAPDPGPRRAPGNSAHLPSELEAFARGLRPQTTQARVETLVATVEQLVRYDRSDDVARRHTAARAAGQGFLTRTLEIGGGDCDVQNSLLVALLQAAGVEARLAIGYLGKAGGTLPFLHAWAEYRDEDGRWSVADASARATTDFVAVAVPPAASGRPYREVAPQTPESEAAVVGPFEAPADEQDPEPPSRSAMPDAESRSDSPRLEHEVAMPREEPAPSTFVGSARAFFDQWPWLVRAVPALLLGFAFWTLVGGRTRRAIKLDAGGDLSRLLQGVLQQPGAFSHMSALFHRPLVPLVGPSPDSRSSSHAISLNKARELASLGRLYRTRERPPIAVRAAATGAAVLDDRSTEGHTVADALGAVDLDRWSRLLAVASTEPTIESLNARQRAQGEDWAARISRDVPGGLAVLDLGPLGTRLRGVHGTRVVLIDDRLPWLTDVRRLAQTSPSAAAFTALDHLVEHLDLPPDRRARLLADAARAALEEQA